MATRKKKQSASMARLRGLCERLRAAKKHHPKRKPAHHKKAKKRATRRDPSWYGSHKRHAAAGRLGARRRHLKVHRPKKRKHHHASHSPALYRSNLVGRGRHGGRGSAVHPWYIMRDPGPLRHHKTTHKKRHTKRRSGKAHARRR